MTPLKLLPEFEELIDNFHIGKCTRKETSANGQETVLYTILNEAVFSGFDKSEISDDSTGLYVIVVDGHPLYCGKFGKTLSKRWFYISYNEVYHHRRHDILAALKAKSKVSLEVISWRKLLAEINPPKDMLPWISLSSVEEAIIEALQAKYKDKCWNGKAKKKTLEAESSK